MTLPSRVIVLDDDPTGTQCASDIQLHLRPDIETITTVAHSPNAAAYVLTNARALSRDDVVTMLKMLKSAAHRETRDPWLLLRGDSTLRGHVFAEIEAIAEPTAATIFVPAYPDAGRTTVDGVHYVRVQGERHPVGETEFAADPVFGFRASRLDEWTQEVSKGRWSARLVTQRTGPITADRIASELVEAASFQLVAPDIASNDDIVEVASGIRLAQARGVRVVVRSAAPLAAALSGTGPKSVAIPAAGRVAVICGSHTSNAARQLSVLGAPVVTLPTDGALDEVHNTVARTVRVALDHLRRNGLAVIATERVRRPEHGTLTDGAAIMAALCNVVEGIASSCDLLITKGGITSAEAARHALGLRTVTVIGQVGVGLPLWRLDGSQGPTHQIVVPGNVGGDTVLDRIVAGARGAP